jgi:hypothetical protein
VRIEIGGNASIQAAGLKNVMREGSQAARPWRIIFLTLSAAILFCVLGAVWTLTQPDKTLPFGEGDALQVTASSVVDHE